MTKRIIIFAFILVALLMISTTAFAVDLTTPSATNLPEELPTELPVENPSELPTVEPDELDFLRESLNDLFILSLPSGTNAPIAITGSAEYSAPNAFSAQYSCGMESEINILDIKFEFEDSKDTQCTIKYEVVTESGDTLSVRRNYTLYYDKEAFLSGAKTIINGIYVEIITGPESFATVFGKVEGQLMMFESDDYAPGIAGKNLIMLTHLAEKSQGLVDGFITNLIFFLDTMDSFIPLAAEPTPTAQPTPASSPTGTPVPTPSPSATPALPIVDAIPTDIGDEPPTDDSGMPQPFDPLQVSVGAILVAAFISLTNASSSAVAGAGMSAFNITSPATTPELDIPVEVKVDTPGGLPKEAAKERFKDAFQTRPESTPETMEEVADISTDSSMQETFSEVASATSQAEEKLASATAKSSPSFGKIIINIFAFIADFIKQLLTNLRDMLTDEARSHTSGKIAETLDDGGDAVEQINDGGDAPETTDASGK